MEHIAIIGGGGTAAALAHDLVLRGFAVSLFERGEFFSGATGRHHGLLHSGGRYAVNDKEAARECIEENRLLRTLVPEAIEQNGGLFVAMDDEDMDYLPVFVESCAECGIPTRQMSGDAARELEPALSASVRAAVQVPDATFDAWRLPLPFLATARANGAQTHHFTEVVGVHTRAGAVHGLRVRDIRLGKERDVAADVVINAAGAWAGNIAALAGIEVPIQPGPGVLVAIEGRVTEMVINRMRRPGEGDIIVPQRILSVLGTSLWLADDPDRLSIPEEHVQRMVDNCSHMVPACADRPRRSAWSAARPLIRDPGASRLQDISRTFDCYDHGKRDGVRGFFSIIGGKAMTLRAMAEKTADVICASLGLDAGAHPCRTRTTPLLPYRAFYRS
ncbi:FAD-dependent oxidoreductase [Nitratidesulfovibrio vulgaris]|uniref:FAD-dependent oxidoreductase n=1 Tax=Nitratidesulfovibrio vulgaris TaxID=881 RepID=UPI00230025FF|nr:FAD-dependent oxidoreductase [Nitratidesulfovibrio vulgaris]WCB47372.1 FAD-dependent oxidoreductase [Nitratidesulfovibrio vulgaris]